MKNSIFVHLLLGAALVGVSLDVSAQRGGRGGRGGFPGGGEGSGKRIEPEDLTFDLGMAAIPDRETFEKLSYQGPDVMRDSYLADLEFVKFIIENFDTPKAKVYFMNTNNHRAHPRFMPEVGIDRQGAVRGAITYLPRLTAPDKSPGLYIIDFQPNDSYTFEEIQKVVGYLSAKMPILNGKVAFHPLRGNLDQAERDRAKYKAANLAVHYDEDLYTNISYLPLNMAESFGRLRVMENEARPSPRDVVIYKTLPNQMPRVAGVITEVRQTPLSHVNLRAVQDKIPNAFINGALGLSDVKSLIGKWVHYKVTPQGYSLKEAKPDQVDAYFAKLRPSEGQKPKRDLSVKNARPLSQVAFKDAGAFGVKAANLGTMLTFDLPEGTVPTGQAIPFHFYDAFMKHNDFYDRVDALLEDDSVRSDPDELRKALKKLRKKMREADMPAWMETALTAAQKSFDEGASIRCRSSTNNEDLPGFSGAGLYDSFTHRADEGPLSKSIKQVFASLWNFRAFEEREFYRIDHKLAAMGVLLHPNYKDEQANGVAVTDDILYESQGNYYLNTQVGEDLVTNPDEASSPEEVLLGWWQEDGHEVVRRSLAAKGDDTLLKPQHLASLRDHLATIHARFRDLYGHSKEDQFAMEIEYKISKEGTLVIKQARPWVF